MHSEEGSVHLPLWLPPAIRTDFGGLVWCLKRRGWNPDLSGICAKLLLPSETETFFGWGKRVLSCSITELCLLLLSWIQWVKIGVAERPRIKPAESTSREESECDCTNQRDLLLGSRLCNWKCTALVRIWSMNWMRRVRVEGGVSLFFKTFKSTKNCSSINYYIGANLMEWRLELGPYPEMSEVPKGLSTGYVY